MRSATSACASSTPIQDDRANACAPRSLRATALPGWMPSSRSMPPPLPTSSLCCSSLPARDNCRVAVLLGRMTSRTGNPAGRRDLAHGNPAADTPAVTDENNDAVLNQEPRGQRALRRFDEGRCRYWPEDAHTEARDVAAAVQSRRSHSGCRTRGWMSPPLAGHGRAATFVPNARKEVTAGDVQHPHTTRQLLEKLPARDEQGRIHLLEIKVPLGYSESPSSSADIPYLPKI